MGLQGRRRRKPVWGAVQQGVGGGWAGAGGVRWA